MNQQLEETNDGPLIVFGGPELPLGEHFNRTSHAVADRKRRREEWLANRRQELRERTRATVIDRVLKKRTQQCAAKRSGDPSLAVGRRLQAKIHAETRKIGVVKLRPADPTRARLPSISGLPVVKELKESLNKGLFNCSELQTGKTTKWLHNGEMLTIEELRVRLAREKKIRESSEARKESRRIFLKTMQEMQSNLRESIALKEKGISATPEFRLLPTSKTTVKARQASVHEWKMSKAALELADNDRKKRRPSVQVTSFPQVSTFALPEIIEDKENEMDIEWGGVDVLVEENTFEMPTIQDFNATPQDKLESTLKGMSLNLLKKLKDHIKAERPKTGVGAEQTKWNALLTAITNKHQNGNKQNGNGNGNGNGNNNNNRSNSNNSNNSKQSNNSNKFNNSDNWNNSNNQNNSNGKKKGKNHNNQNNQNQNNSNNNNFNNRSNNNNQNNNSGHKNFNNNNNNNNNKSNSNNRSNNQSNGGNKNKNNTPNNSNGQQGTFQQRRKQNHKKFKQTLKQGNF